MSTTENQNDEFGGQAYARQGNVWKRGLFMLIFFALFALAETVLVVVAVIQFLWMLFAKEKNEGLADFGQSLGRWLQRVADFQTGATDDKPFPWGKWE
ncbi:MAG: hypothetical protein ACI861_001658 [Paracoccaceae bacterium]|jgi:hypothetical protein